MLAALQSQAQARGEIDWRVSVDSTIARVHQHGATAPMPCGTAGAHTVGARSNDKKPGVRLDEPGDHAIGRSRGGLTTRAHTLVDCRGGPLVIAVTPRHAGTPRRGPGCSPSGGCPDRGPAGRAPDPRRCAGTRRTPPADTARTCALGGSPRSSPNPGTRSATGPGEGPAAVARSPSTSTTARTATSSNGRSTSSRPGEASPPDTTSTRWSIAAASGSATAYTVSSVLADRLMPP